MTPFRRLIGTLALAGMLASGIATTATPVSAAESTAAPTTLTRAQICAQLADYIKRLQALPAGPLRNALLNFALALQAQYCV